MTAMNSPTVVPKIQIMRVLLAKDWRLFRVPTIALILGTLASYGLGMVRALYNRSEVNEPYEAFFSAAIIAAYLVPLLAAAFGGVALAGERSERTADFLALLPVTRAQIVISKLMVSFSVLAAFSVSSGKQKGKQKGVTTHYWRKAKRRHYSLLAISLRFC